MNNHARPTKRLSSTLICYEKIFFLDPWKNFTLTLNRSWTMHVFIVNIGPPTRYIKAFDKLRTKLEYLFWLPNTSWNMTNSIYHARRDKLMYIDLTFYINSGLELKQTWRFWVGDTELCTTCFYELAQFWQNQYSGRLWKFLWLSNWTSITSSPETRKI